MIDRNAHRSMATAAFPNGSWLRCANPECDRGEKATSEDCARYLATGWPTHCGQTMELGRRDVTLSVQHHTPEKP